MVSSFEAVGSAQEYGGSSRFELAFEEPPRRAPACVNVRRDDKEVFDRLAAYAAAFRGRRLFQWEVFTLVLAAALENPAFAEARALHATRSGGDRAGVGADDAPVAVADAEGSGDSEPRAVPVTSASGSGGRRRRGVSP